MTENIESNSGFMRRLVLQSIALVLLAVASALVLNLLRQDGLSLPGDWSDEARLSTDSGESLMISLDDAKRMFQAGQAVFLDARPRAEYEAGHIQGALSLPWDAFETEFETAMSGVDDEKTLIAYCDGQTCSLSHDLALALLDMGFSRVRVLVNGWTVWRSGGLPTSQP